MSNKQTQPASNYFLFYSKGFCEHSKRCIDRLMKCNMLSSMILCNIDDPALMIPPFVTSVPTLYIATERKLLGGNDLFNWIEANNQNSRTGNNTMSMADITGDANIFAFQQNEMSGTGGGAYAFLDDEQNNALPSTYEFLDGSNKDKLVMPSFTKMGDSPDLLSNQATSMSGSAGGSLPSYSVKDERNAQKDDLSKAYEKLIADRKLDNVNTISQMRR